MSTSDIKKQSARRFLKTAIAYFVASVICVVITNVYALYGHGIRSGSMDFMFLFPFVGGTLVFLSAAFLTSRLPEKVCKISRVGYNLYNSGIAALTSAAMLTGIMEIAGTGSKWIQYIKVAGIVLSAAGIVCQTLTSFRKR